MPSTDTVGQIALTASQKHIAKQTKEIDNLRSSIATTTGMLESKIEGLIREQELITAQQFLQVLFLLHKDNPLEENSIKWRQRWVKDYKEVFTVDSGYCIVWYGKEQAELSLVTGG